MNKDVKSKDIKSKGFKSKDIKSIEEIFDEESNNNNINELNGVYNMLGQKVGNTDADLRKLPRGIYIVNGKKRIVF